MGVELKKLSYLFIILLGIHSGNAGLLLGPTGGGGGTAYYFATAGSDSNNCLTTGTACQTIGHANGLTYASGSTIRFNGGDTFTTTTGVALTTTNAPSGGVTVGSYGTGAATITSGNSAPCITATNVPSIGITGSITCTGGGISTNTTDGILILNNQAGNTQLAGPTINPTALVVSGYGHNGINIQGNNASSGFTGISLTGNITVHDVTGNVNAQTACITIHGAADSRTVMNNIVINGGSGNSILVYNCTGVPSSTTWSGSGIFVAEATNTLIENAVAHDFGNNTAGSTSEAVGIWCALADNCTIQQTEAYNGGGTGSAAADGYDFDGGTINSIAQFNWSHNNAGAGYLLFSYPGEALAWANNAVRFNISQNNGSEIRFDNDNATATMTGVQVYNNTFVGNNTAVAACDISTNNYTGNVANNIFIQQVSANNVVHCATPKAIAFNGNDYYGSANFSWSGTGYTTFATWKTGSSQETVNGGFNSNPLVFVLGGGFNTGGYVPGALEAYNIRSGSPMLPNAGINLTTQFSITPGTLDFFGNAVTASTLPVGAGTGGTSAFATSCTASTNYAARVSGFAILDNINYNSLLCGMNSDGDLVSVDALYILSAPNSAASLLNLISTSYSLTSHGTVTFTAETGTAGDGTTGYLSSGFIPSSAGGHFTLNSATIGSYDLTSRTSGSGAAVGGYRGDFPTADAIFNFATANPFVYLNEPTGAGPVAGGNARSLVIADRTGASAEAMYVNGASVTISPASSVALGTIQLCILAACTDTVITNFTSDQLSAVLWGGAVNLSNVSYRLNTFMKALGINVY
jgi:hypothetical protein